MFSFHKKRRPEVFITIISKKLIFFSVYHFTNDPRFNQQLLCINTILELILQIKVC